MLKVIKTPENRVPSRKTLVPFLYKKGSNAYPTEIISSDTLLISGKHTFSKYLLRGSKQKAAASPLASLPSLFAVRTPKAFVSTLMHRYWSYFWPRVTWLCLHNWVPTSWSATLIVCKIIAGKCPIPKEVLVKFGLPLSYSQKKKREKRRKKVFLQKHF